MNYVYTCHKKWNTILFLKAVYIFYQFFTQDSLINLLENGTKMETKQLANSKLEKPINFFSIGRMDNICR